MKTCLFLLMFIGVIMLGCSKDDTNNDNNNNNLFAAHYLQPPFARTILPLFKTCKIKILIGRHSRQVLNYQDGLANNTESEHLLFKKC